MIQTTRLAVAYNLWSNLSLMLCSGCVRVCSALFELYWLTKPEFWFYIIWLMKTIDNVPYSLPKPKSTVYPSTTTKFSTRIRLNLVGFQTFARRARTLVTAKLNLLWEDPVTVRVLTVTGSSEDSYTVMLFGRHRILREDGNCPRSATAVNQRLRKILTAVHPTKFSTRVLYYWYSSSEEINHTKFGTK
jgi:hypothetical protein